MSLVMTAAPAAEPVTLAEAKAHLRVEGTSEDALISSLIVTSRLQIEAALGLALVTQGWTWSLDAWPEAGAVDLPLRPVQSIATVKVRGADGAPVTLATETYVLDGQAAPARLVPSASRLPDPGVVINGIEIAFAAGFGDTGAATPAPIRQALLMLVAHWFENREPVSIGAAAARPHRIPDTVSELLAPYRIARL